MTFLKIVSNAFLLFCIILTIKSESNTLENTRIVNNLFKCIGWKHLNRVKNVTYLLKKYDLPSIIQLPISPIDCNIKLRTATVFLGCTYASILMDILTAVNYHKIFCDKIMSNESNKTQGYNCTVKLLKIIFNTTLFTKKMHGALYAIDNLHRIQWQHSKKGNFILNLVFEEFQNLQKQLNNSCPSRDDMSCNKTILRSILLSISNIITNLEININHYCKLECNKNFLITKKLNALYKNVDMNAENIVFYYCGSEIILHEIEMLTLDNFTQLGFEFNIHNEEIFIPRSLVHLYEETNNESKNSPATTPVLHDFLQKETNNESKNNPATTPILHDFLQKETDNESETSSDTIPVFYDFLQKDLIGDTTMNEESEFKIDDLNKKDTQNFIKYI